MKCPAGMFSDQVAERVHDRVAHVMGNPAARQSSPSSFFSCTYSAEISAVTPSFFVNRSRSLLTSTLSSCSRRLGPVGVGPFSAPARFSNTCRCQPLVEQARLEPQLVAQVETGAPSTM
jgi:hypothetical protein